MTKSYDRGFDEDPDVVRRARLLLKTDNLRVCLEEFVAHQLSIVRDSSPTDQASRENAYHSQRGAEMFVEWMEGLNQ